MKEFDKSNNHKVIRIEFNNSRSVFISQMENIFGEKIHDINDIFPISTINWDKIEIFINWVINNTDYTVLNINDFKIDTYNCKVIIYFMK